MSYLKNLGELKKLGVKKTAVASKARDKVVNEVLNISRVTSKEAKTILGENVNKSLKFRKNLLYQEALNRLETKRSNDFNIIELKHKMSMKLGTLTLSKEYVGEFINALKNYIPSLKKHLKVKVSNKTYIINKVETRDNLVSTFNLNQITQQNSEKSDAQLLYNIDTADEFNISFYTSNSKRDKKVGGYFEGAFKDNVNKDIFDEFSKNTQIDFSNEHFDNNFDVKKSDTIINLENKKINEGLTLQERGKLSMLNSKYVVKKYTLKSSRNCLIHSLVTYAEFNKYTEEQMSFIEELKLLYNTEYVETKNFKNICEKFNIYIEFGYLDKKKNYSRRTYYYGVEGNLYFKIVGFHNHYIADIPTNLTAYYIRNFEELEQRIDSKGNKIKNPNLATNHALKHKKSALLDSGEATRHLLQNYDKYFTEKKTASTFKKENDIFQTFDLFKVDIDKYYKNDVKRNIYKRSDVNVNKNLFTIFFDFECSVEREINQELSPFICKYLVYDINEEKYSSFNEENVVERGGFKGAECAKEFLEVVYKYALEMKEKKLEELGEKQNKERSFATIKLIAHNLKFDFSFLFPYIDKPNLQERGNGIQGGFIFYKGLKIAIQDSFALIPMALKDFSVFNIGVEKEIIPYNYYSSENVFNKDRTLKSMLLTREQFEKEIHFEYSKKQYKNIHSEITFEEFLQTAYNNVDKFKCFTNEGLIDMFKYNERYCYLDVEVLAKGYIEYRILVNKALGIDAHNYTTISSLADDVAIRNNGYNDRGGEEYYVDDEGLHTYADDNDIEVKTLDGVIRMFVQKSVAGGVTQSRRNMKIHIKNKKIVDLDVNSLYPYAVKLLCKGLKFGKNKSSGVLLGMPKILTKEQLNYEFIDSVDGAFVEILINKVNKKRDFSIVGLLTSECRLYNDKELEGSVINVDITTLKELIKYNKIEYEILQGVYYDEGRSDALADLIIDLYNKRLDYKNGNKLKGIEKNKAMSVIYKLVLNSIYGFCNLKAEDKVKKYIKEDEVAKFIENNAFKIDSYDKLSNGIYCFTLHNNIINHVNRSHIGSEILSASKVIMNRFKQNCKVLYTDTDSLIMTEDEAFKLKEFLQSNKKDNILAFMRQDFGENNFIGNKLGQVSSDFESDYLDSVKKDKKDTIVSNELIVLGKKFYMNVLTLESNLNANCELIDENIFDLTIRCKGINTEAILYEAREKIMKEYNLSLLQAVKKIYLDLLHNKSYHLDLTANFHKASFENKGFKLKTKQLIRKVEFVSEKYLTEINGVEKIVRTALTKEQLLLKKFKKEQLIKELALLKNRYDKGFVYECNEDNEDYEECDEECNED
jgi:hypothetical protein